ncbi:hypothetical protein AB2M62_02870 [Sphingomonas sp. MMS12-HWE2-04]|uniref:hypothetical protein n=1 Tax=Sphingomonas sp. MMS12-HWE2-04 TaxID=3234199 RepID=UPI00384F5204
MAKLLFLLPLALPLMSAAAPQKAKNGRQCVIASGLAAPVVRDDGRVYFRGQPDPKRSYIAVFKGGRCLGMNRFATVVVETTGAGYCEGDKLRALNLPSTIPGPICVLDHLEPFAGDVDD